MLVCSTILTVSVVLISLLTLIHSKHFLFCPFMARLTEFHSVFWCETFLSTYILINYSMLFIQSTHINNLYSLQMRVITFSFWIRATFAFLNHSISSAPSPSSLDPILDEGESLFFDFPKLNLFVIPLFCRTSFDLLPLREKVSLLLLSCLLSLFLLSCFESLLLLLCLHSLLRLDWRLKLPPSLDVDATVLVDATLDTDIMLVLLAWRVRGPRLRRVSYPSSSMPSPASRSSGRGGSTERIAVVHCLRSCSSFACSVCAWPELSRKLTLNMCFTATTKSILVKSEPQIHHRSCATNYWKTQPWYNRWRGWGRFWTASLEQAANKLTVQKMPEICPNESVYTWPIYETPPGECYISTKFHTMKVKSIQAHKIPDLS